MWILLGLVANLAAIISAQNVRFQLSTYGVDVGSTAILKCLITAPKKFEGFYDASDTLITTKDRFSVTEFESRGEYDLTIASIQEKDHGKYFCKAKGGAAEDTAVATLTIRVAIPDLNPSYKMAIGDRGQIKLRVAGYPRPQISWEKEVSSNLYKRLSLRETDGTQKGDSRYFINEDGSLFISQVTKDDAGKYRVNAPYVGGVAQKATSVIVGEKPKLEKTPVAAMNATEKGEIKIDCKFVADLTPTWKHNSTSGVVSTMSDIVSRIKITKESLVISNAARSDEGTYTCSGSNEFGVVRASTKLQYVVQPAKLNALTDVTGEEGVAKTLTCTATGYPAPVVTWHKESDGKFVKLDGQKMSAGKSEYIIAKLKAEDRGKYRCTAQNGAMKDGKPVVETGDLELFVYTFPIIDAGSFTSNLKYKMGANETKTISCTAQGFPSPSITFQKDGKNITENVKSTVGKQSVTAVLTYKVTSKAHLGKIICLASNARGSVQRETEITAIYKPGKPRNLVAADTETNYVLLRWESPKETGNDAITSYEVIVTNPENKTSTQPTTKTELQIENLERGTKYRFAVRAKNNAGFGSYSDELKVETKKLSYPGSPIVNNVPQKLPTNEIVVGWARPADDGGSAALTYKVTYCKHDPKTGAYTGCNTIDAGSNTSTVIRSLAPETQYKVTVTAHNNRGGGKSSSFVTMTGKITKKPKPSPEKPQPQQRGLGGGAIAGIVIAVILIVLIVVDLFCCFFNNCGFTHCCYETFCAGKSEKIAKYEPAEKEEKVEIQDKNNKQAETV